MSSASAPRPSTDTDSEIYRLSDPADDDANAAPTKVGPMSKAFVEQLMFKAHIAESSKPPAQPPVSEPPASGKRPRIQRIEEPGALRALPADVPVLDDLDSEPPFEPTVLAPWTAPRTPAPVSSAPPAMRIVPTLSYAQPPEIHVAPIPAARSGGPVHVAAPPIVVLWSFSNASAPWHSASFTAEAARSSNDRQLAMQVAAVLTVLGLTITAVIVWLFP